VKIAIACMDIFDLRDGKCLITKKQQQQQQQHNLILFFSRK